MKAKALISALLLAACQTPQNTRMLSLSETLRITCDLETPVNGYNDPACVRAKHEHAEQLRRAAPPAALTTEARASEPAAVSASSTTAAAERYPAGWRRCYAIPGDKLGGCYPYITLPGGYRQLIVPGRPRDYPLPVIAP